MNIKFFMVFVCIGALSIDLNCTLTERLERVSSEGHMADFNSQDDCKNCCGNNSGGGAEKCHCCRMG